MSDGYQFLLDAPGEPVKKIQVAQLGDYKDPRYGEFKITADDVKDWQKNLAQLPGGHALIDRDHLADKHPRNTEAYGWVSSIDDPNAKGEVWATPEWTSLGKDAIVDRRYLFTSPAFGPYRKPDGTVIDNVFTGVTLTNKPMIDSMATITLAAPERVTEAYEQLYADGDPKLLDISQAARKKAASEGQALGDGSYPIRNAKELHSAAVLAASGHGDVKGARALIRKRAGELGVSLSHLPGFADDSADSRRTMATTTVPNPDLLKLLDLPEDADEAKILEAVEALKTTPATETESKTLEQQAEDAGKTLLDKEQVKALVADAQKGAWSAEKLLEMEFDSAFNRALAEGRVRPAERDLRKHFFTLDKDATLKDLAEREPIVNMRAPAWDNTSLLHSDPDAVPVGVHPGKHALHVQIMKTLEAEPTSDYETIYKRLVGANQ